MQKTKTPAADAITHPTTGGETLIPIQLVAPRELIAIFNYARSVQWKFTHHENSPGDAHTASSRDEANF
jgi:hypothetical protein